MICNKGILHIFLPGMIFFNIFSSVGNLYASGKDILKLGKLHIDNGEYYNAITEMMRYQCIFPRGQYYSDSMLLIRGPLSDSDHWLNEIPDRLTGAEILAVPPTETD